jgi:Arc/MetJ-type ribon-helix-helix transcriptional regulator
MKMASMNISLPEPMADYVRQVVGRDYGNASEYFRDLVRDRIAAEVEADLQLLREATQSAPVGPSETDIAEILGIQKQVRKRLHARRA